MGLGIAGWILRVRIQSPHAAKDFLGKQTDRREYTKKPKNQYPKKSRKKLKIYRKIISNNRRFLVQALLVHEDGERAERESEIEERERGESVRSEKRKKKKRETAQRERERERERRE